MGKQSAPASPDYTQAAVAQANSARTNEVTPQGTTSWSLRPGADPRNPQAGDWIHTTELAPQQQALYDTTTSNQLQAGGLASEQLSNWTGGQEGLEGYQDTLYRRGTSGYDRRFENDENDLRTRLANQGLVEGSDAWNRSMEDFRTNKNTSYADAHDRAVVNAQQTYDQHSTTGMQQIMQLLAAGRGENPGQAAAAPQTDLMSSVAQQHQAQMGATNAGNAQNAGIWSSIAGILAAWIGAD